MQKSCPSRGSKLKKLNFPSFALSIKQPPRSGMSSAGYPKLNASVCQNCCIGRKRIPLNESPLLNIIQHQFSLLGKIITENWIKLFNQNRGKEFSLTELALSWSLSVSTTKNVQRASEHWRVRDRLTWVQSTSVSPPGKFSSVGLQNKCCLLQSSDSPASYLGFFSCWFVLQAECLTRSFEASQSITSSLCKIFLNQQRFCISSTCLRTSLQASRSSLSKISVRGSRSFSRVWRENNAYWQRCCWSIYVINLFDCILIFYL